MSSLRRETTGGLLALFVLVAFAVASAGVLGLGTVNTENVKEIPVSMVSINGNLVQKAEMAAELAGLAISYTSAQQLWRNAVSHALRGHEEAVVKCIEWYHFHYSWSEVWLSGTDKVKFDGVVLPSAVAAADLTKLLGAQGNGASPCAGLTQEVINREFNGDAKKTSYKPGQLRAVIVFARNTFVRKGQVVEKYLPLTMYLVYDWERWRCDHGYTSMIYPTPGYRSCP